VFTLSHTLLTLLKLFAPILPHVTERIYQGIFAAPDDESIHTSWWPVADDSLINEAAEDLGETLIEIATTVRRFKSERNLSLGSELKRLQLATEDLSLRESLTHANADLMSITRAASIEITAQADIKTEWISISNDVSIGVEV
jgi:valyl-tRNA synthetase